MARAHAEIGSVRYATRIRAGHHDLIADEGAPLGGQDAGPSPFELLVAALGACTAITLKMYAERKAWPLEELHVGLLFQVADGKQRIDRTLTVTGDLDDEQRARLADIAERTPVTLTLKNGLEIKTELR
jgi:putative redox protein